MLPKSGFTLELVNEIMLSIPDIGVDKFFQRLHEYHINQYLTLQQRYYEHCFQYINKNSNSTLNNYFSSNVQQKIPPKFSKFEDSEGYQGNIPSATLIRECFLGYFENHLENFYDKWMRSLSGQVLSSDHTFKIASFVWNLKNQPFGAFWAVLNEFHEVITMAFVKDKSNNCIKPMLNGLKKRYDELKKEYPWAWYSDQCCIDRKLITSVFSNTEVKKDLFHFLDLYLRSMGKEAQGNIFYKQFIRELRDAFFIIIGNKKIITQPKILEKHIVNVFEKYKDSKYGIITDKLIKQHKDNLNHIKYGCISDVDNKPSELLIQGMYLIIIYNNLFFIYYLKKIFY